MFISLLFLLKLDKFEFIKLAVLILIQELIFPSLWDDVYFFCQC
jgi:hypothetical protein